MVSVFLCSPLDYLKGGGEGEHSLCLFVCATEFTFMFVKNLYLIRRSDDVFKIDQRHPWLWRSDGSQVQESVTLQEKARGLVSVTCFGRGQLGLCQQGACPGAVVMRLKCKILSVFQSGLGFSYHPTYTSLLLLREISVRLGFHGR